MESQKPMNLLLTIPSLSLEILHDKTPRILDPVAFDRESKEHIHQRCLVPPDQINTKYADWRRQIK